VRLARYPSAVSCWYASTTTPRETPRSAASTRVGGSEDPRGSRPARIASRIEVSICRCSGTCASCRSITSSSELVLSAVGAAVVPVAAGVAMGERPSVLAIAGVLVSLPAIVLVAASGSVRGKLGAGLVDGLVAGLAFGVLFVGLAQAGRNAGLWPVASEQTGTLLITLAVAVKTRASLRIPVRAAGLPVLAGAAGMAATLAYFYATHFSMLAIAVVLVSLYPGVTVMLARAVLHERFSPAQRAGLGLATLAIIAIALN